MSSQQLQFLNLRNLPARLTAEEAAWFLGFAPHSIPEAADMLGLDYFSVYRLIQRGKLKACRALRGKFLIPRTELFRLLNTE